MKGILGIILACFSAFTAFAATNDLSQAGNTFALNLLGQIASAAPSQNIFISPYSVSTALQMLDNGASGKTKTEIERVLKTEKLPPNSVNEASKALSQSLRASSGVELDVANSIWFDTDIQLKPAFVSANKEFFESKLAPVDFQTPEAADTINHWAASSTHGKITDIVSFPFPAATQLVLANAIYFKAKWTNPFDPDQTQPRNFYLSNGMVKMTQMMYRQGSFHYQQGPDFQALNLSYAGGQLYMTIMLPATNSSPQKLLMRLKGKNRIHGLLRGLPERKGTVILPKFKINYDILLNDPLQALGMKQAFIPGAANFSGITDEALNISEVTQKSFINVDETGTEAAAVTTVVLITHSIAMPGPPPFEMRVDRPFLFMISDGATGTVLLTGIINDPTLH